MKNQLKLREEHTLKRTAELRNRLHDASFLCASRACVYVTGSFGRLEAGHHSDLDVFIVGRSEDKKPVLKELEATCIKADLIRSTRDLKFPDFSGDGRYLLRSYDIKQIIEKLGTQDDDSSNTFTARLLLLLESRPLIEEQVHADMVEQVVKAYWRDYESHKDEFVPAYLTNDILRLWRTFCVNYEARTDTEPEEKRAERKLKNYKLKHSRLLTCYSSLMMLLAIYSRERTVTPEAAFEMTKMTPSGRVKAIVDGPHRIDGVEQDVSSLFKKYDRFLQTTDDSEANLIARFLDRSEASALTREASEFGEVVFNILSAIGQGNRFHRLLVV